MLSRLPRCWPYTALLLAGCASAPVCPDAVRIARQLALPPAVLAVVAGGALRQALPFGDPVPSARGVLVQQLAPDHWRLAFAPQAGGYVPLATHRLAILPTADPAGAVRIVDEALPAVARVGDAPGAGGFWLEIRAAALGAEVTGDVPAKLAPAVERAIALAIDPAAALPGLEEPNLATWAAHRLLADAATAEQRGDWPAAHALRQAAARLPDADFALHARLADDAERRGEFALAADHGWRGLLASRDPRQRSIATHRLAALAQRGDDPVAWRAAAREQLLAFDPERAAAMLHTARRLHDEPALDYRLQSRLHRLRNDGDAAAANALLAREHAGLAIDMPTFVAELWLHLTPPTAAFVSRAAAASAPSAHHDAMRLAAPPR